MCPTYPPTVPSPVNTLDDIIQECEEGVPDEGVVNSGTKIFVAKQLISMELFLHIDVCVIPRTELP